MIWFVTMLAGVFGLYAKGHKWASKVHADPIVEAVDNLTTTIADYGKELHSVAERVTALEDKDTSFNNH